jgi:glycosyltransferase involved in cell wall biosynthesis
MKLSIIMPVFNEKKTLPIILNQLKAVKIPRVSQEIVIVDDHSTDGTKEILKEIKKKQPSLRIIFHSQNQGKGAAVRTGLHQASGDIFLIQDADLEYDPQDIPRLIKPIQEGKAEVVYGSRFTGERRNMLFWHMMGNRLLTFLTNLLYNTTLSDMEVCYKLFTKKALKNVKLKEDRFGFDPEITAKVLKIGFRIYEVPISYAGREFEEGKKIKWHDGLRILWVLIKYRFLDQ